MTNPLSNIRILHIDPDKDFISLTKNILRTFGFVDVDVSEDGKDAIRKMRTKDYDLVICDWKMSPMSGLEFIDYMRRDKDSPDVFIPIIMLTARAELSNIRKARDLGVTEFLAKPFTINALRQRIISVVERPREFVIAKNYCGPSRRRKRADIKQKERRGGKGRKSSEEHGVRIVHQGEAKIISPSFKLKRKLGAGNNIEKIISLEKIKEAEVFIQKEEKSFVERVLDTINILHRKFEVFMSHFLMNKNSHETQVLLEEFSDIALKIKGLSGIFGYSLATSVAKTLFEFCTVSKLRTKKDLEIIDVHIDALETIYKKNIKGEYGEIGRTLISELEELIKRNR